MKYYIFRCEKLVRDRIPELMSGPEDTLEIETLDHKAHIKALKKKLIEEAEEVFRSSSKEEIIEEIADVNEVLDALMLKLSISRAELSEIKRVKSLKKGGFNRGLFLKTVKTSEGSPTAVRFLKEPSKYPMASIS